MIKLIQCTSYFSSSSIKQSGKIQEKHFVAILSSCMYLLVLKLLSNIFFEEIKRSPRHLKLYNALLFVKVNPFDALIFILHLIDIINFYFVSFSILLYRQFVITRQTKF